jgi:SagB-type dehydrogenase family enzyme
MIPGLVIVIIALFSTPAYSATIGERFHEDTKLTWFRALRDVITPKPAMPPQFKEYRGERIRLPKPSFKGMTLEDAILKRRSVREYTSRPLTILELSQLLFSAQGVTGEAYGTLLRTAPSAGALYPIEVYAIVNSVDGLRKGIYHYSVRDHSIALIREGEFGKSAMNGALKQEMMRDAGVVFVISAIFDRVRSKYGERGYRYAYMEAGHVSQNIYLQATSLGLGSVVVGAFIDDDINELIGVDGKKEAAIALHAVGSMR